MPRPTPEQLDIPLVWDRGHEERGRTAVPERVADTPPPRVGWWFLWLAAMSDLGVVVLATSGAWATAAWSGIELAPVQLALVAAVGLEFAAVLGVGCIWPWRQTPGMMLVGIAFEKPLPFARACRLWLVWLAFLPVLGVPLVARLRGVAGVERLAGSAVTRR